MRCWSTSAHPLRSTLSTGGHCPRRRRRVTRSGLPMAPRLCLTNGQWRAQRQAASRGEARTSRTPRTRCLLPTLCPPRTLCLRVSLFPPPPLMAAAAAVAALLRRWRLPLRFKYILACLPNLEGRKTRFHWPTNLGEAMSPGGGAGVLGGTPWLAHRGEVVGIHWLRGLHWRNHRGGVLADSAARRGWAMTVAADVGTRRRFSTRARALRSRRR
mmetsp:Transcript_23230/g.58969  ORF Transcript_23230/g.58969 Transcript_23230/m.58969 type:complete len:214 (-) Transcript_23230:1283-1924(-)